MSRPTRTELPRPGLIISPLIAMGLATSVVWILGSHAAVHSAPASAPVVQSSAPTPYFPAAFDVSHLPIDTSRPETF